MMNDQSSSAVYALFFEDTDQDVLLGLYFLEGEAVAARAQFVADEVKEFPEAQHEWARKHYKSLVHVVRLPVGQAPSFHFARPVSVA